jgi:hypothetical protein
VFARTIDPLLPKRTSRFVPEPIAEALLELHRDDNRALAERIGRELGHWGYY